MTKQIYSSSSRRLILGFSVLIILQILGGSIALISINKSQTRTQEYNRSLESTHKILTAFQKQITTWKDVLIEFQSNNKTLYRKFYLKLSYDLTAVQDELFNLKLMCSSDPELVLQISEFIVLHNRISKNHFSTLSTLNENDYDFIRKQLILIDTENKQAFKKIDKIVEHINYLSETELAKNNEYYYNLLFVALVMLTFTAIFLMKQIIKKTKTQQNKLIRISKKMNSYLPPQLVQNILTDTNLKKPVIKRQFLTICFTDLKGFTEMTDHLEPETCSQILNEYLSEMTKVAHAWGGMIDKFMGDGIMILFGAPDSDNINDEAFRCVQMAIAMQKHLQVLNKKWEENGINYQLGLRIGIHSGYATLGSFGTKERRAYTAIGTTPNIAARLESLCPVNRIIVSKSTCALVNPQVKCTLIANKKVKGIKNPILIYNVDFQQHQQKELSNKTALKV